MKHIRAVCLFMIVIPLTIIQITSCKKTKTNSTGTIFIHLHTNIDTTEVGDTTKFYPDGTGRHFGFTKAQFFVSGITLHNVIGSTYSFNGTYILKTIDSEQYLVGTAPVGTYDYVTFTVGLAASVTPAAYPDMAYSNTSQGYMFMKVQGFADTSAAQDGTGIVRFLYELGTTGNMKTVTMPVRGSGSYTNYSPYILTAGNAQYVHLVCDYSKLLAGVNFKTQDSTDSYTLNPALSVSIANNIPTMFRYEE